MKSDHIITQLLIAILMIPIIVLIIGLAVPFLVYWSIKHVIQTKREKAKLKDLLKLNEEHIYLLYANYNTVDFSSVMHNTTIEYINVDDVNPKDLLAEYLIRKSDHKSYPRLIKIENNQLVHKVHFDTFKYWYKRQHNLEAFLNILNSSITNLNKTSKALNNKP